MKTFHRGRLLCCSRGCGLAAEGMALRVVSGRPDMVTGGMALVEISAPGLHSVHVSLNGRERTKAFRPGRAPGTLLGRVEGLKPGKNTLEAREGGKRARLELVNSPMTEPCSPGGGKLRSFATPRRRDWARPSMRTAAPGLRSITSISRQTEQTASGADVTPGGMRGFKKLDPVAFKPADLAKTTTSEGKTVNYIIRREMGTINRAIYSIAFLHEPGEPLPDRGPGVPAGTAAWSIRLAAAAVRATGRLFRWRASRTACSRKGTRRLPPRSTYSGTTSTM